MSNRSQMTMLAREDDTPVDGEYFPRMLLGLLPEDAEMTGQGPSPRFAASVADLGVRVPVILERAGELYRVRDGQRRITAARMAGQETVPALVFEEGEVEAGMTVVTNSHRSSNEASEFEAIRVLMKQFKMSPVEVAADLKLPAQKVKRLMRLQGLIPQLQRAYLTGQIRTTTAFAALKLPMKLQKEVARALGASGKVTTKYVTDLRDVRLQQEMAGVGHLFETPGAPAPPAPSWPVTIGDATYADAAEVLAKVRPTFQGVDAEGHPVTVRMRMSGVDAWVTEEPTDA